jgi:predicted enzyme related to lactoylglutathione lyase
VATNTISAVLFAKDSRKLAAFYRDVLGASLQRTGPGHEVLNCLGFHLVVHQIPDDLARSVLITTPPERRERTAIRLNFPVDDVAHARRRAKELGGQIDDLPPPWAAEGERFFLGHDPEGNVVGVMPANQSLERAREG